jgi:hypothetical protein
VINFGFEEKNGEFLKFGEIEKIEGIRSKLREF